MAEVVDNLRLGVEAPDETAESPGSAGVDGGGWGPGGLSDTIEGSDEGSPRLPASDVLRNAFDDPSGGGISSLLGTPGFGRLDVVVAAGRDPTRGGMVPGAKKGSRSRASKPGSAAGC